MNILVVAPHPDDDIIGCGGSIASHIKQGNHVTVVYVTSGDAGNLEYPKKTLAALREKEVHAAAKVMGIHDVQFLRHSDGYVELTRNTLIELTTLIRAVKPHTVYLPHAEDGHSDHRATYQIVVEAIKRSAMNSFQECKGEPHEVQTVLGYEVWSPLSKFEYVVNISEHMDLKIRALEEHKSQLASVNYTDAVKALNRYRGVMSGKGDYCECFQVLKVGKIV